MSFLRDYLEFSAGNEAHEMYHLWSALTALSSIIGRRVWLDQGHYCIYCNLYTVLVGPPGNRKTTAMSVAKRLVRQVGDTPFAAESMSREGLIKLMAEQVKVFTAVNKQGQPMPMEYAPMSIFITELKEFIGVSNVNMINFLTTIWDQDFYDYKTRNKEDLTITNPYLTLLACETPEWITLRLKDDVISGGFSRRAIMVYPPARTKRIAFPEVTPTAKAAWDRVVLFCKNLLNFSGAFIWEPEAHEFYKNWYEVVESKRIVKDSTLVGYYESRHILLLKIAMMVAISEGPGLLLKKEYLQISLGFLEEMEVGLPRVFEGLGRNELNAVLSKAMDFLIAYGKPMQERHLKSLLWRYLPVNCTQDKVLEEMLNQMRATDKVTRWSDTQPHGKLNFICIKGSEPADVKRALERVPVTELDSPPVVGPPSAPLSTETDLELQHLLSQPIAPSPDADGEEQVPKESV